MEEAIPMWNEYLLEKAKILNLKDEKGNPEKCSFYDIFAPIEFETSTEISTSNWTYNEAKDFITENGYDPVYGARPLKRYVQKHVETLAARIILQGDVTSGDTIEITVEGNALAANIR